MTRLKVTSGFIPGVLTKRALRGTLAGADLTGANLAGATSGGADVTDVIWSNTVCPDSTNIDDNAGTCVGHGF